MIDLHARWESGGRNDAALDAVRAHLVAVPDFEEVTRHRVLVHSSGFQMSPYADVKPSGEAVKDVARKLWHRSPGSPG